jgi:hypothetical protein
MQIQLLNSFRGDDIRDIDTSTDEGKGTAAKLISDLIRSGSALFLEKEIGDKTYTYRVSGYDAKTDKIKLTLVPGDPVPEDVIIEKTAPRRGRSRGTKEALYDSSKGRIVSVAPVAGGLDAVEEPPVESRTVSWEAIRWGMDKLCVERGWHHGCPMPSAFDDNHRLVLAKGSPLYDKTKDGRMGFGTSPAVEAVEASSALDGLRHVNTWSPPPKRVEIYRDNKGSFKIQWPTAHERLKFWLDTIIVRGGAMNWDVEITAMASLQQKITDGQWASYVLSGAFPETSERSGVTYILRRGFPTIAMREKVLDDGKVQRKFLAAMCLHGVGYYEDTWAGCQPPSDEVISHLMMIRADEHGFWKRSGQHSITDPRAAI